MKIHDDTEIYGIYSMQSVVQSMFAKRGVRKYSVNKRRTIILEGVKNYNRLQMAECNVNVL